MKKQLMFLLLFIFAVSNVFAQQNDSARKVNPYIGSQQKKKSAVASSVYFGGNLFFTLGNYTSIGIWPMVGYKVTPKLSLGLQPGYEYLKYDSYYGGTYESSNYGVRIFSRYRIVPQAYAHVEFATINYETQFINEHGAIDKERNWVPFLFVGGGLSQPIGGGAFAYIQVLYDVLQDEHSPHRSSELFWSFGIVAGF